MSIEAQPNALESEHPRRRRSALRVLVQGCLLGIAAVFVGFVLGMVSYDKRFITDKDDPAWEFVGQLSYLFISLGLLTVVVAIVGIPTALVVRAVRRGHC